MAGSRRINSVRRTAYLQAPVLFSGGIVKRSLLSWLQYDSLTGFFKVAAGAYTPTNHGATNAEGWVVGDRAATYFTLPRVTEISTEQTIVLYLNPILSTAHQAVTDTWQYLFCAKVNGPEIVFRTGSLPGLAYFINYVVNYAGVRTNQWVPAARLTGPVLLTFTATQTRSCIYNGKTLANGIDYAGSSTLPWETNWTFLSRYTLDGWTLSDMGLRDILIYNRALSAGEVAKNVQEFHL
jgi:hypothetical protein